MESEVKKVNKANAASRVIKANQEWMESEVPLAIEVDPVYQVNKALLVYQVLMVKMVYRVLPAVKGSKVNRVTQVKLH